MSTEFVEILAHPVDAPEVARRLLAAADDPRQVRTSMGGFLVPAGVAAAAGLGESPEQVAEEKASASKRSNRANPPAAPTAQASAAAAPAAE